MMKKVLLAALLLALPGLAQAALPTRYVQISTNTLTRQAGASNIEGISVSTVTVASSMTVSGLAIYKSTVTFTGRISTSPVAGSGYGTSGMALQSQGAGSTPTWSFAGLVPQVSTSIVVASSATTVSSFVSTGLTRTITPKSTSSAIWIGFSGNVRTSNCSNLQAELSIFNGTTDLCGGGSSARGCAYIGCAAGTDAFDVPASFFLINCPATTSAVTYTLRIKADGSGTATVNNQSTQNTLMAFEIGPGNGLCP